jgi:hypothetical protein
MRKKRRAVHNEREWVFLDEVALRVYSFDQYVEQDDGILCLVTERPVGRGWNGKGIRPSGVWFCTAAKTDD